MNKNIEKLIQESTTTTTSYYDGRGNVTESYFDKEKFAKLLIIKTLEVQNDCPYHISQAQYVREYFGVKK
jgi:hypothetical protein